jgi:hypothetical protein
MVSKNNQLTQTFSVTNFFHLTFFLTIISQIPQIIDLNVSNYFQLGWLFSFIMFAIYNNLKLNQILLNLIFVSVIFIFTILSLSYIGYMPYSESPHWINALKTLFVIIVSYNMGLVLEFNDFRKKMALVSLVGGGILAYSVYIYSFSIDFNLGNRTYAYNNKNSVSQLLLSLVLMVILFLPKIYSKAITVLIKTFFSFMLFVLLLFLKSRATILSFILIFIYFIYKANRAARYFLILLFLILFILLIYDEYVYDIIVNQVLLNSSKINNLNEISSGRLDYVSVFLFHFFKNPFLGNGYVFVENYLMSILVDFGIVLGMYFIYFLLLPIYVLYVSNNRDVKDFRSPLDIFLVIYYFNSLFEQQAPLGPGSKNFLLWMFFGFYLSCLKRKSSLKLE